MNNASAALESRRLRPMFTRITLSFLQLPGQHMKAQEQQTRRQPDEQHYLEHEVDVDRYLHAHIPV